MYPAITADFILTSAGFGVVSNRLGAGGDPVFFAPSIMYLKRLSPVRHYLNAA